MGHRELVAALRQAALWRLGLLLGLAAVCGGLHARSGEPMDLGATYVYATLAVAFLFSVVTYLWLRLESVLTPRLVPLTLTVDLTAVTALTAFSGGATSIFGFLYTVVILEAAVLGGLGPGLVVTTAASGVFVGLAFLDRAGLVVHANHLYFGAPAPQREDFWVIVALQLCAFYLVAILSGQLARRIGFLERQQENLLEHFSTGYLAAGPEGQLTFINSAGRRILGLGPAPLLGTPLPEVFRTDPPGQNPATQSLSLRKEFFERPCLHWSPDGRQVPLEVTTTFIRERGHHIAGVMAHFSDQTLVQELENTLRQQDRLALAGELSASLAHEVRNPVAAIRSTAQELAAAPDAPDDIRRQLFDILMRESDQLNRVVSHFLEYARLNVASRTPVNVRALLNEVVLLLDREPERVAAATIETVWQADRAQVAADVGLLKQAFLNIAQNALDAMPEYGTLRITTRPAARPGLLEIEFADTGAGMTAEQVAHVFEPFFTTKASGTGLGLAIVHRIVQAHGGTIEVNSQPGKGTRVIVRLPASEA